jgi:drug/metabolite transporter (DMT)-like permease
MTRRTATLLGLVALVAWSTSNALTRDLSGRLGPFTLLAFGFGTGGLLLSSLATIRSRGLSWASGAPVSYVVACGSLLALYLAGYAGSLWLAPDDGVALVLGLVNYLWPTFVLLFSLVVFPWRARWGWLGPGVALGLAGIVAAAAGGRTEGLGDALVRAATGSPGAFVLMLGAAVSWGLYTNLARRLGGADGGRVLPLLLLACGLLFLVLRFAAGERSTWEASDLPALAVFATVVCGAGYALWDAAVRAGDLPLLGAAANATPVAATLFAVAWLGEPLTGGVVLGSVLVSAGAVLARRGVVEVA